MVPALAVRDRDGRHDGRAAGGPRRRDERRHGRAASGRRRRPRRGRRPGTAAGGPVIVTCRPRGRAAGSTAVKRTRAAHPATSARARAPSSWTSSGRRLRRAALDRGAIRAHRPRGRVVARLRRRSPRPAGPRRAPCAPPAPRRSRWPSRHRGWPTRCRCVEIGRERRRGRHRHGRRRRADAAAGDALRVALDLRRQTALLRGRCRRARMLERVPLPGRLARARGSTAWSATTRCIRSRRRCTTPRFARPGIDAVYVPLRAADFDDFLTFADGAGDRGCQRDDSVQARRAHALVFDATT